ncbi:MAG: hypothetical protein JWM11_6925 [Planctomycetaceae bacterium]|nr:hypothetical protein [Planctomycetaceae bacterium]
MRRGRGRETLGIGDVTESVGPISHEISYACSRGRETLDADDRNKVDFPDLQRDLRQSKAAGNSI